MRLNPRLIQQRRQDTLPERLVSALSLNDVCSDPCGGGSGDQSRAQQAPGEVGRVEPGTLSAALHDQGYGLSDSLASARCPCRLIGRHAGPSVIPDVASQSCQARTGQVWR